MAAETRRHESTAAAGETLFMSFELGSTTWKLAFATTRGMRPRLRTVVPRDLEQVRTEIITATKHFGLAADAPVRSCYEAGRDGFWLHRALSAQGIHNVVVDPASITVDRRARRAKTDRIDAIALVIPLMNAAAGDRRGWRELRVPSVQAETDRHLQREWETVRDDRTRLRNRIQGLLATQGVTLELKAQFGDQLAAARHSELSRWFHARFGQHGRARRIGIVAVARKLMIALWRYVETDTVPKDAVLKT